MSKISELVYAIQEDLDRGLLPFAQIAIKHGVPVEWVEQVNDEYVEQEVDCDDSDDGYALASAGFGTDEDYGCYSDF